MEAYLYLKEKFVKPLYRYGSKICSNPALAKEVVADLFVNIWIKRATLGPAPSVSNYLYLSLRRNLLARIEKDRRYSSLEDTGLDSLLDHGSTAEERLIGDEQATAMQQRLQSALAQLSSRQREAIHLRFFEERDYEDIATMMDMNTQSAYNLIHRSLKALRSVMGNPSEPLSLAILLGILIDGLLGLYH